MAGRFIPPLPNCGHVEGVTFTWYALGGLFLCAICDASIGRLALVACARCGNAAQQLTPKVGKNAGRICFPCRRDIAGRLSA